MISFTGLFVVCRLRSPRPRSVLLFLLSFLLLVGSFSFAEATDPSIHGLRLGISVDDTRALFQMSGIELTDKGDNEFSARATPEPLDAVKEVRLTFVETRLRKIVISFQIPPYDATAETLVKLFETEKQRLISMFQSPGLNVVVEPPSPQDRYEWIRRGRAYYRTTWESKGRWKAALWLFGEDAGIVLMEVCEATDQTPRR
ncbi:MAG: hypothetical protein FJ118_00730 [Deltaproteobacteria bacterium]|nr:hypothetical protein [Deltaproteobacteria bacterium]